MTNPVTRAEQIRDATATNSNTAALVGGLLRDLARPLEFNIEAYGASPTGLGADNDTAIAAAVTAAIAADGFVIWPASVYPSAASIPNFHGARHRGGGVLQRGGDLFVIEPNWGDTNRLYVATTGNAANDGLSSAQPTVKPQDAFTALKNYGPVLEGAWKVIVAAGTYAVHSQTFDVPSRDWVTIQGPTAGHPNVPTAIFDGSGFAANQHGFIIGTGGGGAGVKAWFQDIKCQDYNAGSQNSCGWSQGYAARCIYVNCHASNCDFAGILADQGDICLVSGGIISTCRSGVILNATKGSVGYNAASTADGTQFTGCTQNSIYWSRGAQGHVDYCVFTNAPYHVQLESASRAHLLGNDFRTATTAAVSTNTDGSYYDDVSVPNVYNDGTGLANVKRYDHFAFTGEQQKIQQVSRSWCRLFSDTTTRTLTNAAKTQIGADITALAALLSYFTSEGTAIRVVVQGDCPAAAYSIGVDFFNAAGPTTTVMDYSASTGVPGAVGFTYVCEIHPSASAVQRTFSTLSTSNLGVREQNTGNTANMALTQTVRLMGQSTAGAITVRRVEVWVLG